MCTEKEEHIQCMWKGGILIFFYFVTTLNRPDKPMVESACCSHDLEWRTYFRGSCMWKWFVFFYGKTRKQSRYVNRWYIKNTFFFIFHLWQYQIDLISQWLHVFVVSMTSDDDDFSNEGSCKSDSLLLAEKLGHHQGIWIEGVFNFILTLWQYTVDLINHW